MTAWTTDRVDAPKWFFRCRAPALREVLETSGWSVTSLVLVHGRHEPWLYLLAEQCP
ncbi:MAG: hypothetical protein H7233_15890 [Pseudorhodobacter sp.]|nr:hypothetical protein [Frankiaceae bacterium]